MVVRHSMRLVAVLAVCGSSAWGFSNDLVNMPSGRVGSDGTWSWSFSYARPYAQLTSDVVLLPWLEVGGGITEIFGVPGFVNDPTFSDYGNYKDKNFEIKAQLLSETATRPAVSLVAYDPIGTGLFRGNAVVASKKVGNLDVSLGFGDKRPQGMFGGVRYELPPADKAGDGRWSVVAEKDATPYAKDKFADVTGLDNVRQKVAYGVEYRWKWLGLQFSRQHGSNGLTTFVEIPLQEREFLPKMQEPERFRAPAYRPDCAEWEGDPQYRRRLIGALLRMNFQDIGVRYDPERRVLALSISHPSIHKASRAVGQAAQAALLLGPRETREIEVTYVTGGLPMSTYSFFDVPRLQKYFNGEIPRSALADYVDIRNAAPSALLREDPQEVQEILAQIRDQSAALGVLSSDEGDAIAYTREDYDHNRIRIKPYLQTYLNGPGAFQYVVGAMGTYDHYFSPTSVLNGAVLLPLKENLTDAGVVANKDSSLPQVRSDLPLYREKNKARLQSLMFNKYAQLGSGVYGRASVGLYEEMYGGFGGQMLWVPEKSSLATDVAVDVLRKRDTNGGLGFLDYKTVTALASFHYRLGQGVTATARVGKFLAKDDGVRFEIKRRFESGIELGAWYSRTNANDRGGPAQSEGGVYYDKGIFANIPFDVLMLKDTRAKAHFSLAPWTRDDAQMVVSPGDLYEVAEDPLRYNRLAGDGLSQLADVLDDPALPSLGTGLKDRPLLDLGGPGLFDSLGELGQWGTWKYVGVAAVGTGLSTAFDKAGDRAAKKVEGQTWAGATKTVGNLLPFAAVAFSAVAALDREDNRFARTGLSSLIATGLAVGSGELAKIAIKRSRPDADLGPHNFSASSRSLASFPSGHTEAVWAAVTPFAKEYDAPWLYGAAAVTNVARMISRQHWFSDTVAATFLGYGLGHILWDQRRQKSDTAPTIFLQQKGIGVSIPLK